jgi:hypothetical protein
LQMFRAASTWVAWTTGITGISEIEFHSKPSSETSYQ